MSLKAYQKKRNLKVSKEPAAKLRKRTSDKLQFVVQKHAATHLHYDFRLEMNGVLKSWAIPKGPSMNPEEKRLAVQVEDHPFDYKDFEGVIPEGYGAGTVRIWDRGTYTLDSKRKNSLRITLHGKKLKGGFALVRFRDKNWLLIKSKDEYAKGQSKRRPSKAFHRKRRSTGRE